MTSEQLVKERFPDAFCEQGYNFDLKGKPTYYRIVAMGRALIFEKSKSKSGAWVNARKTVVEHWSRNLAKREIPTTTAGPNVPRPDSLS